MTANLFTTGDDLAEGVHVELKLLDIIVGGWRPTEYELVSLVDHLAKCSYCRGALGVLLAVQLKDEPPDCLSRKEGDAPPDRLAETVHETDLLKDIGAYVEILETQEEVEARKRFPQLAAHLDICEACRVDVQEIRALLHEAEEDGLIEPLCSGTHC